MRGVRLLHRTAWLAALGMLACAPAADFEAFQREAETGELGEADGYSGVINVARSAPVSLSLRGGLGPIVEGQTVNRAIVSVQSIELVGADGSVIPFVDEPFTADLLAIQNDLEQLVAGIPLPPGEFTHLRVRLDGALIEVTDDQGATQYFATPGFDVTALDIDGVVGPLELVGIEQGGYFDVPVPPDGITIQREAALALQLDPALSFFYQDGIWAFEPRSWVVDQAMLSSLEVAFQAEAAGFSEFAVQGGFQVTLFDAGMHPVAVAPLGMLPGGLPGATFQYLAPFQGPFVAVLVPPPGVQLTNVVSVAVDVRASAFVQTSVVINSFSEVRRQGGFTVFDIGFAPNATVIQRGPTGQIIYEATRPVGPIEAIMPRVAPRIPRLPWQSPPRILRRAPYLAGLPRPIHLGPGTRPWLLPDVHRERPRRWRPGERPGIIRPGDRFPGGRPGVIRPGDRFPGGRPGVTRPGDRFPGGRPGAVRPGDRFPGGRPGVTRPGDRFPGGRPSVTRPGDRFPGGRPGAVRPGDRPQTPSGRPGVSRPGQRPQTPSGRPGVTRPGGDRPGGGGPGMIRPGGSRPRGGGPGVTRPRGGRSEVPSERPVTTRRPDARRPGDYVGAPVAPPAMRSLEAPAPMPERRPRVDPRRPRSERPPARSPSRGRDRLTVEETNESPDQEE